MTARLIKVKGWKVVHSGRILYVAGVGLHEAVHTYPQVKTGPPCKRTMQNGIEFKFKFFSTLFVTAPRFPHRLLVSEITWFARPKVFELSSHYSFFLNENNEPISHRFTVR